MRFMCVSVYARTCFYFYMKILTHDLIIYKLFPKTIYIPFFYPLYMNATTYPEFPYTPADYEDIENYFKDLRAWYAPLDE